MSTPTRPTIATICLACLANPAAGPTPPSPVPDASVIDVRGVGFQTTECVVWDHRVLIPLYLDTTVLIRPGPGMEDQ